MNNKVLCCLICVVVVIVLLSIVITKEKFDIDSAASQYSSENNYNVPQTINSIVSKIDGTLLNVAVIDNNSNDEKTIELLVDNYGSRLCMEDNTNNLSKCDNSKQWKLKFVNNSIIMNGLSSNLGQSSTMVNYPFFMVLTLDNKFALQYNNGRFSVSPVGNYDSQKWDVSDYEIPQKQLFVNDIYDGPLDKMPYSQASDPKDRVKINLNINDERLKELLHIDSTNTSDKSNDTCDTFVPRNAINGLCAGCK
jgi:hypothetical protein